MGIVLTWILAAAVVWASGRFGSLVLLGAVAFVSFLSLKEYFTVTPSRRADRPAHFVAYASVPLVLYYTAIDWYNMFVLVVPVYVFLLLAVVLALTRERRGYVQSLGRIAFGTLLFVHCLGHAGYLYRLNARWFVTVLVLTELADRTQGLFSRWGPRSVPAAWAEIGVRKTPLGCFLSGVLLLAVALAAGKWNAWPMIHSLGVGALATVLSLLGDAVLSSVRFDLGVGGGNPLVPGRGKILDRVRAAAFTFPVLFHYLRYFLS